MEWIWYALGSVVLLSALLQFREIADRSYYVKGERWAYFLVLVSFILFLQGIGSHMEGSSPVVYLLQLYSAAIASMFAVSATTADVFYGGYGDAIWAVREKANVFSFVALLVAAGTGSLLTYRGLPFLILWVSLCVILILRLLQNSLAKSHISYFSRSGDAFRAVFAIGLACMAAGFALLQTGFLSDNNDTIAGGCVIIGILGLKAACRRNITGLHCQRW